MTGHSGALTLRDALVDLARRGRSTPCQIDPAPFTSDELEERREAAQACTGCPILDPCRTTADAIGETFHVWGGADRSPTTRRKSQ